MRLHYEVDIDLPDVPVDLGNAQAELIKTTFTSGVRKNLKIAGTVDRDVYIFNFRC